eukprot:scaffold65954_cov47-Prasinocladus_malaysianus.AAC.4
MYDPKAINTAASEQNEPETEVDGGAAVIRIQATRAGRGGKTVTIITGVPKSQMKTICKQAKSHCGTGGSIKGDTIEIQGNHTVNLVKLLRALGYNDSKISGG